MTARERDWKTSVARSGAADDVMAATGIGETECRRRHGLSLADPARVGTLVRLLTNGELALWQVLGLHDDTADLEALAADEVAQAVTAPTRTGERPSVQLRRRRLRRELVRHGAQSAGEARALGTRDMRAELSIGRHGLAPHHGDGGRLVAAIERVDHVARGIRAGGQHPDRTLAQLRSDVALDLILHTPMLGDPRRRDDRPLGRHRGTASRSAPPDPDEDLSLSQPDRSLTVGGIDARPDDSAIATRTENDRAPGGIPRWTALDDPPPY